MDKTRRKISYLWFCALVSVLYFIIADAYDLFTQPHNGFTDGVKICILYAPIVILQVLIISALNLNRYVFAVVFVPYLLLTTVMGWFAISNDIVLSPTIIGLVMENDLSTSSDFITLPFLTLIIISVLVGVVLSIIRVKYVREISKRSKWIILATSIAAVIISCNISRVSSMLEARQPFCFYYSIKGWIEMSHEAKEFRDTFTEVEVTCDADTVTVVLVIGESLRTDHLGINGYHRQTTPRLSEIKDLVSLTEIHTDAFHTAISIPRIMTMSDDSHPDRGYDEQSFITIFDRAGFSTWWIANQEPLKSFVYFTREADHFIPVYAGHSHYNYALWTDTDLMPEYIKALDNPAPKKLIILHTIGNHWWFKAHYTPDQAQWMPDLESRNLKSNTQEQIVNAYDNSTLVTDEILAEIIGTLNDKNAVMIYLSDHGENLGEDGVYLHAVGGEGSSNVAALVWASSKWTETNADKAQAMASNSKYRDDTGFLFHSILDCADIRTDSLDISRSIFRVHK